MKRTVKAWAVVTRDTGFFRDIRRTRVAARYYAAIIVDEVKERVVPCVVTYDDGRKAKRAKKARGAR